MTKVFHGSPQVFQAKCCGKISKEATIVTLTYFPIHPFYVLVVFELLKGSFSNIQVRAEKCIQILVDKNQGKGQLGRIL
jgi:hypothetical protein